MEIRGFYINLDRSVRRREALEGQLDRLGLRDRYQRFPAVKGNTLGERGSRLEPGEIGCFVSHCRILQRAAELPQLTHVVEDDVALSTSTLPTLNDLTGRGVLDRFDLLFTDTVVPIDLRYLRRYKRLFDGSVERNADGDIVGIRRSAVIDLKGSAFAGTTSYLVAPASAAKLAGLLEQEMDNGPASPIDLFIRKLVDEGALRAGVVFPFATAVNVDLVVDTTIVARDHDYLTTLAVSLIRNSFHVGDNPGHCEEVIDRVLAAGGPDRHRRLLAKICGYVISGDTEKP